MEPLPLLDGLVLAALARGGPTTGRGVASTVGRRAPVYPVLRRLEREQLVTSRPLRRSPRRTRLYRITDGGGEALVALRLLLSAPDRRSA
jgi:DNA-binding PadR family transcriptional regulator